LEDARELVLMAAIEQEFGCLFVFGRGSVIDDVLKDCREVCQGDVLSEEVGEGGERDTVV
jgi:hypothetical protein